MEISRVSKECFRGILRKFHVIYRLYKGCSVFDRIFKRVIKEVSRRFQESAKNVSRVFFGSLEGLSRVFRRVLIHLSKGQLSKDHFVQGTLVQEDFCPRKHWSNETFVQGESLKY